MFQKLPVSRMEFRNTVLKECVEGLRFNHLSDNFDSDRFRGRASDRQKNVYTEATVGWLTWFFENCDSLFDSFELLEGEKSKRLFLEIIAYRIAGHECIRIGTSFTSEGEREFIKIQGGGESNLSLTGPFGSLKHYNFDYEGKRYKIDCLGLEYYLYRRQYFYDDGTVRIQPEIGDFVIDGGACSGDSAIVFGKAVCPNGVVYSFDPVEEHLELLRYNARQNPDCQVVALPYGLSNRDVDCPPMQIGQYAPGFDSSAQKVPLRTIDTLVALSTITRVDFIKLDIEGAELDAIEGAVNTIQRFRPKMAISIYHYPNDLFAIPMYLRAEFPFYEMYLGHYTIHNEETVIYCIPKLSTSGGL